LIAALPRQRNHGAYSVFGLLPADRPRLRDEPLFFLGSAITAARALRAQQKAMPVLGFLSSASPGPYPPFVAAFRQGLSDTGYVEDTLLLVKRNNAVPT
jgi:hypothetical protein